MKKVIGLILIIIIAFQLYTKQSPALEELVSLDNYSIFSGELIVVNQANPILEPPVQLEKVDEKSLSNIQVNGTFYMHKKMVEPLKSMLEAAADDGVTGFILNSAYRNSSQQHTLFEDHGSEYALPAGYSEHETGLAIDIGSVHGTMDNIEEGIWLAKNSAKYGFILRYPEDKVDITGISYEPWHFRYVGLPHSLIMERKNFVLEQYLDFLKEKELYTVKINGTKYVIQYVTDEEAHVPSSVQSFISGNNIDGYFITSIVHE